MYNNNEKKGKFNAIDALLILLAILCVFGVAFRAYSESKSNSANLAEYRKYFKIDDISSASLKYFTAGDIVRVKSTGATFGKLDAIVQHVPAVGVYNENGAEIFYPETDGGIYAPTRYSVVGYITVRGEQTKNGFLLGGETYVASGSEMEIVTDKIQTTIKILSIDEK